MTLPVYKRAGLIGVGLMGASVAMGLKKKGIVETWVGMDQNPQAIEEALKIGAIQEVTSDFQELACQVDWLLLAVPVRQVVELSKQVIPLVDNPDYFIIDVGSTKCEIVSAVEALFLARGKPSRFIGCHPIAGKEKTGPLVADTDLFQGKTVYVTPTAHSDARLLETVESLWRVLGAQIKQITPERHDEILAGSSHLPHMIAFSLMDAVERGYETHQINQSLGGGLRDMTRIVGSSAQMWAEIGVDNRDNIIKQIDSFRQSLDDLYRLLKTADVGALAEFFADKKKFRETLG